jgi:hypothetical protein
MLYLLYILVPGVLHLFLYSLHRQKLHVAPNKRDNVAGHCCRGPMQWACNQQTEYTPSSASVSTIAPATMSPTPTVEGAHQKNLLHWDGELLDGWHLECVMCHKSSGGLSRLRRKAHCCHLSHDGGLVCQKLVDYRHNFSVDSQIGVGVAGAPTDAGCSPSGAGCSCGSSLGDRCDCIIIGVIIAFHDIVDCLVGVSILAHFWPYVLWSSNAMRHLPYALWKNVLRAGYLLLAVDCHMLNSLSGNMLDVMRMQTVVAMIWSLEYRTFLVCQIS